MELKSVTSAPGFRAGLFGPLHISIWDTQVVPEHARSAAALLAQLGRVEDRALVLAVLGPNTPPPDGIVRDIFASEFSRLGPRVVAVANVIEGQGFRAAAMRAVVTGLALVIQAGPRQKACMTLEEGAMFIAERSEGRLQADAVRRAALGLRLDAM